MTPSQLQQQYAQQQSDASQGGGDQSQQPQDLTVPGQVVAQIAQFIQSNDCASVCKLMAQVISGGQSSDDDSDDQQ